MKAPAIFASTILVSCGLFVVFVLNSTQPSTDGSSDYENSPISSANNIPIRNQIEVSQDNQTNSGPNLIQVDNEALNEPVPNLPTEEQPNRAINANLDGRFLAEEVEDHWARRAEAELLSLIADAGIPANLFEVECRSRTCRITLLSNTPERVLTVSMMDQVAPLLEKNSSSLTGGWIVTPRDRSAPLTEIVVYLSQDWDGISFAVSDAPEA